MTGTWRDSLCIYMKLRCVCSTRYGCIGGGPLSLGECCSMPACLGLDCKVLGSGDVCDTDKVSIQVTQVTQPSEAS